MGEVMMKIAGCWSACGRKCGVESRAAAGECGVVHKGAVRVKSGFGFFLEGHGRRGTVVQGAWTFDSSSDAGAPRVGTSISTIGHRWCVLARSARIGWRCGSLRRASWRLHKRPTCSATVTASGGGWPLAILLAAISEQFFARMLYGLPGGRRMDVFMPTKEPVWILI